MLLTDARGSIAPTVAHPSALIDAFDALAGLPLRLPTGVTLPAQCLDGRADTSVERLAPHSSGGTVSLWVTTLLCNGAREADIRSFDALCSVLRAHGLPCGGHDDAHAAGTHSGCGAADHLSSILALIDEAPQQLTDIVASWGCDVSLIDEAVRECARNLAASCPPGSEVIATLRPHAEGFFPCFNEDHAEQAVLVNPVSGTVIDRHAVAHALVASGRLSGMPRQFFAVDTWAFPYASEHLHAVGAVVSSPTPEVHARCAAILAAVNAATVMTLCAPGIPVVTLDGSASRAE